MEQNSVLINVINYVQYNRDHRYYYKLDVKALEAKIHRKIYHRLREEDRQIIEQDFGDNPDKLKGKYLDKYD